ncbi:MAG: endonuclease/exonuclease/phosphatase family protein [Ginsengibacter sp.]
MPRPFIRRFTKKTFIFSNALVGILFLAGSNVKYFDIEKWWFLSLFTLLLPYLLAVLLGFILFWLIISRPFWSFISIAVIFFSLHAIQNIIPFNLPETFSDTKDPQDIRIMSWNVELFNILNYKKDPEKRQKMFDLINKYDPDIACFQEVVAGEDQEAINYLPDIINALNFKDYLYSYQVRDNFDRHHHFGILVLSKYPILRKQTMVNNPNDYNSVFQFIDVLINNDTFRVFNVHLQSLKFTEENLNYLEKGVLKGEKKIQESKSIISKIKDGLIRRSSQASFVKDEMNHSPYPVIFCGDFNDVPVSYAYETIGKGLQNAFVQKGFGIGDTYGSLTPTLRIDNIFLDKTFKVEKFTRIRKPLSDHYPIFADVKIK